MQYPHIHAAVLLQVNAGQNAGKSSTSTPEYLTLLKFYAKVKLHVKLWLEDICDRLFEHGYLSISELDYVTNDLISKEERAEKILSILMLRVAHDPSIFFYFAYILRQIRLFSTTATAELLLEECSRAKTAGLSNTSSKNYFQLFNTSISALTACIAMFILT